MIIDNRKYGQVRLIEHNDGTFEQISILYRQCPCCGDEYKLVVNTESLIKYSKGMQVQDAFPNEPREVREEIMSGICIRCQREVFDEQAI